MGRFKTRKRNNLIKIIICILLILLSFFITIKVIYKIFLKNNNEEKINRMISLSTNNIIGDISFIDLVNFNLSPESLLKMNFNNVKKIDYKVKEKEVSKEVIKPIVYIYNTHQSEEYNAGYLREYNIIPTVYMASNMLGKSLKNNGIGSIVENANIKELLNQNDYSYNDSYKVTRSLLDEVIKKEDSLNYFIDVHRDSTSGSIIINDKSYAKMMFVIGMNHNNYQKNLDLVIKINDYINESYPGVMRDVFYGKRSTYNQDFNSNTLLIEIGGPDNTIDEVYNSVLIFSEALYHVIGDA